MRYRILSLATAVAMMALVHAPLAAARNTPRVTVAEVAVSQRMCTLAAGQRNSVRDSAGVRVIESASVRDPAFTLRVDPTPVTVIGEGRNEPEYIFGRVDLVARLANGDVVISDRSTPGVLRVFSSSGQFVGALSRQGQGPGEFEAISGIIPLGGDTLLVADHRRRRLTTLTSRRGMVDSREFAMISAPRNPAVRTTARPTPASISFIAVLRDGSMFGTISVPSGWGPQPNVPPKVDARTMLLLRIGANGEQADTVATVMEVPVFSRPNPGGVARIVVELPYGSQGLIAPTPDGFYQTFGSRYEIVRRNSDGRELQIIRICRAPDPVRSDDVARFREAYVATARAEYRALFQETASMIPYPKTKPAFTQLVVDGAGRLWARAFVEDGKPQLWHVFAQTGQYLGDVTMPATQEVVQIGTDFVLTKVRDGEWATTVRLYRVHGGS